MSVISHKAMSSLFVEEKIINQNDPRKAIHALIDGSLYMEVRERATAREDEDGNYDYSHISNVGMAYLYVHNHEKRRKEKTKEDYMRTLLGFLKEVEASGRRDIRELSRFDMEEYQARLQMKYPKSNTQAKKVVILYSFLFWCFQEGYLRKNIARGLRPVKKVKEEIPERDIEELDLKDAIQYHNDNPKVQSLLLMLATSGMRLNEVIAPNWGQLYFDRRQKKHYLVTRTKRDKIRHVHIKDYALEALREYRRRLGLGIELDSHDETPFYPNRLGQRYRLSSLSAYLSRQMEEAGLTTIQGKRVTPHFMRHYFAQTAFANGAPLDWISETIDHSSTKITKDNYLSRQMKKERDVSDYVNVDLPQL